jgi:hypothetical protein
MGKWYHFQTILGNGIIDKNMILHINLRHPSTVGRLKMQFKSQSNELTRGPPELVQRFRL